MTSRGINRKVENSLSQDQEKAMKLDYLGRSINGEDSFRSDIML
jgi:hypothetical protein